MFTTIIFIQGSDPNQGVFEIFTEVVNGADSVKFEMFDAGPIWENTGEDILPLVSDLDYAHACWKWDRTDLWIPTSTTGENYGIYHTATYDTSPYRGTVVFGNGKYKMTTAEYQSGESFFFYIDYTTDNYTYDLGNNDIWVKYDIANNSAQVRWSTRSST
jgi:hypothetical protein